MKKQIIFIIGEQASGKSTLAIDLFTKAVENRDLNRLSFYGTTNNKELLKDTTENVRFLNFDAENISESLNPLRTESTSLSDECGLSAFSTKNRMYIDIDLNVKSVDESKINIFTIQTHTELDNFKAKNILLSYRNNSTDVVLIESKRLLQGKFSYEIIYSTDPTFILDTKNL